jgi:hypothetical protein
MQSKASTVKKYLASLPDDRRAALEAVRKIVNDNLDEGFEEGMSYGMMGWHVPHSIYPGGYHCNPEQPLPFAGLASQKNAMSLYLMCIYGDEKQRDVFLADWKKTGKKMDMGKACIRFRKLDDLPLDVIGRAVKRVSLKGYVAAYDAIRPDRAKLAARAAKASPKPTGKPSVMKKTAATKTTKEATTKATKKRVAKK